MNATTRNPSATSTAPVHSVLLHCASVADRLRALHRCELGAAEIARELGADLPKFQAFFACAWYQLVYQQGCLATPAAEAWLRKLVCELRPETFPIFELNALFVAKSYAVNRQFMSPALLATLQVVPVNLPGVQAAGAWAWALLTESVPLARWVEQHLQVTAAELMAELPAELGQNLRTALAHVPSGPGDDRTARQLWEGWLDRSGPPEIVPYPGCATDLLPVFERAAQLARAELAPRLSLQQLDTAALEAISAERQLALAAVLATLNQEESQSTCRLLGHTISLHVEVCLGRAVILAAINAAPKVTVDWLLVARLEMNMTPREQGTLTRDPAAKTRLHELFPALQIRRILTSMDSPWPYAQQLRKLLLPAGPDPRPGEEWYDNVANCYDNFRYGPHPDSKWWQRPWHWIGFAIHICFLTCEAWAEFRRQKPTK